MKSKEISLRVLIIGDHPWKGETATLVSVYQSNGLMPTMGLARLDDGQECFVEPHQVRQLPESDDQIAARREASSKRLLEVETCELLDVCRRLISYTDQLKSELEASQKEIAILKGEIEGGIYGTCDQGNCDRPANQLLDGLPACDECAAGKSDPEHP